MTAPGTSAPGTELANQPPPYEDVDLYSSDRPLMDAVASNAGAVAPEARGAFGRRWGSAAMFELGRQANAQPPQLEVLDPQGFRRDTVEFHPAYHDLMAESVAEGLSSSTWSVDATPAPPPAQVLRAARFYMAAQAETGHLCPAYQDGGGGGGAGGRAQAGRDGRAEDRGVPLRPPLSAMVGEGGRHARHGHDRAAGRHRRAHQHQQGGAGGRGLSDQRAQMV